MLRRTLNSVLLLGFSVWLIQQTSQVAAGDDKPAKKTVAAKEQASTAAKDQSPTAAAGQDKPCKAAAEKKELDRHAKKEAKPRHHRHATSFWDHGPQARPWGGPWARGPRARAWDDPWEQAPRAHDWGGPRPYYRPGWGAGPWAQGPRAGHWGCPCPYCRHGWSAGRGYGSGCPWAQGPRARHWGGPWAHHRHAWDGPGKFRGSDQGKAKGEWPSADQLFQKFDANNDGAISKEEFAAGLKKVKERLHGGKQAPLGTEMKRPAGSPGMRPPFGPPVAGMPFGPQAGKPPSVANLFDRFDKSKDGKLVKDEVPAPLWEHISKADANKDGAVTKDELETAHKKLQEQFRQRWQERAATGKGPQAGPPQGGTPRGVGFFDPFDKNKDGKLTKDEVPERLWEHISKADANKDGAVTKDELEAARKKAAAERGIKPAK